MNKYSNSVAEILGELNITDGLVLDPFHIVGSDSLGEKIKVEAVSLNDLEKITEGDLSVKAILVDDSISQKEVKSVFQNLHSVMQEKNIYLILCAENPVNRDMVFELLSGHQVSKLNVQGYTAAGTREYMSNNGFVFATERLQKREELEENRDNLFLQSGNLTYQYLSWMEEFIHSELNAEYFVQAYTVNKDTLTQKEKEESSDHPFLSIITRTQGRRPESLRETFLTLAGQSCMDFEVLVMGHELSSEETENVLNTIEEYPEYLKRRIRYIPVTGGNRSTPINRGFEEARGDYAIILDDDDYVFDNWVAEFKKKAEECPGSVLHAYVIAQDWTRIVQKDGKEALRASGTPQNQFCRDFHVISELYGNYCPPVGLAFPLFPFRYMGIRFDETLDTTEDWDYLMRIRCICGVVDIQEPTCLYRLWKNAESSRSVHSQKEWKDNRNRIMEQFKDWPLQLPVRYTEEMMKLAEKYSKIFSGEKNESGQTTPLYYSNDYGFSEDKILITGSGLTLPDFRYEFTDMEGFGKLSHIRWDPYESGNIYVENLMITIYTADGRKIEKSMSKCDANGFKSRNCIIFFHPDPQVVVHFRQKLLVSKIVITGRLHKEVPVEMHNYLAMQYDANLVHKAKKAVKYIGKKILRR